VKGKAIGYVRVSTGAQASSGLGIEAQEASIRRWCAYQELELVYIYEDAGASGGLLLKNRPSGEALWKSLEEYQDEPWSLHLVASKLDRYWRNVRHMHHELGELEALQVNVHTSANGRTLLCGGEGADRESLAISRLMTEFVATVDELERIRASERTAEALNAKKARGEWVGVVPFGYRVSGGQLVTADADMATLGMIWHFRTRRKWCWREIREELQRRQRSPHKRSKNWSVDGVRKQAYRMTEDPELVELGRQAFEAYLERSVSCSEARVRRG